MRVYAVNITLASCPFQMSANLYDAICATRGIRRNSLASAAKHTHCARTLYVHSNAWSARLMTGVTFQKASFHPVRGPDTFYVLIRIPRTARRLSCGCRRTGKGNFMMFFSPQELFNFQSHSQHLWLWRITSHIIDLVYFFWLLLCSISLAAE